MASKYRYLHRARGEATVLVEMPDAAEAILEKIKTEVAPAFFAEAEDGMRRIYKEAMARWPVNKRLKKNPREYTGRSRDNLRFGVLVEDEKVLVSIWNEARDKQGRPYWHWIKTAQNNVYGSPFQALVNRRANELRRELKKRFPELLKRKVRKREFRFNEVKRV